MTKPKKPTARRRLGEILVERKAVTPAQVDEALVLQVRKGRAIGELLLDLGYISQDVLDEALAFQKTPETPPRKRPQ